MRTTLRTTLALTSAVALASTTLLGCSKEKEGEKTSVSQQAAVAENAILNLAVLKQLPSTTTGFSVIDFSGAAFKKWSDSRLQRANNIFELLDKAASSNSDEANNIWPGIKKALTEIGLVNSSGTPALEQLFSSAAIFAEQPAAGAPTKGATLGVYALAAEGVNLQQKLKVLRDSLASLNIQTKDAQVPGTSAFAVVVDGKDTLFFGANEKSFGATGRPELLAALFDPQSPKGIDAVRARPDFKRLATSASTGVDGLMNFNYFSTEGLLGLLETFAAKTPTDTETTEAIAELTTGIRALPVESLVMTQGFSDKHLFRAAVSINPKTDLQRAIFDGISKGSLPAGAKQLPSDTAFALALDTKILGKVQSLVDNISAEAGAEVAPVLKGVQGVVVGVRNNDGGSPIPEIMIMIDSANRDAVATQMETGLSASLRSFGQEAPWMAKEIAGSPARYFTTMLGIGLYITKPNQSNSVILTSSERAAKDLLKTPADGIPAMTKAASEQNIGSLYLNFPQLANVADSIKSSVAMFTGGAAEFDEIVDSAKLRTMGQSASSINFDQGILVLNSTLELPMTK